MENEELRRRLRTPARASLAYLTAGIIVKAVGMAAGAAFTRLQSGEQYGEYTLYISILALLGGVCSGFCPAGVLYRLYREERGKESETTAAAARTDFFVFLLICPVLFAFSRIMGLPMRLAALLPFQILCDVVISLRLTEHRYRYRYRRAFCTIVIPVICSTALALLTTLLISADAFTRAASLLLFSAAFALPAALSLFNASKGKKVYARKLARLSLPLLPHTAATAASAQTDRLVLTALFGAAALAKYAVVHSLAVGLTFAVTAVGSALYPWLTRRLAAREYEKAANICEALLFLLGIGTVALLAFIPEATLLLAPADYLSALPAALPIAISTLSHFILSAECSVLGGAGRGAEASICSVAGTVVGVLCSFLLIPPFGYLGAALSVAVSSFISATLALFFAHRCDVLLFSPRRCSLIFLLTLAYGVIISLLYNYAALRILLLIPPSLLAVQRFYRVYGALTEATA